MSRAYWPLLLVLSALWGASYLFINVAVRDLTPATAMAGRLLVAAVLLIGFLAATRGLRRTLAELRGACACCRTSASPAPGSAASCSDSSAS